MKVQITWQGGPRDEVFITKPVGPERAEKLKAYIVDKLGSKILSEERVR